MLDADNRDVRINKLYVNCLGLVSSEPRAWFDVEFSMPIVKLDLPQL